MAKIKKVDLIVEEPVEEVVVEEPTATFADTIEPEPQISATVSLAILQAQDRLARDIANFPK